MEEKELKAGAINIKGKEYILVSQRILFFNDQYKNGYIQTRLVSKPEDDMVVIQAVVVPDVDKPGRSFTGYSQATWGDGYINKTSAIENCETSAVGRALGFMGIGIIDSVASADEVNKVLTQPAKIVEKIKSTVEMKTEIAGWIVDKKIENKKVKEIIKLVNPNADGWDSLHLNNAQRGQVYKAILNCINGGK